MDRTETSPEGDGRQAGAARRRPSHRRVLMDHAHSDLPDRARRALARLNPMHREVVVEVTLRGRTAAEVAEMLGIPVHAVKTRLAHALRAFREHLIEAEA
jgi:DNA-directed RNA polymerase specialized sigma24 family protein